MSRSLTLKELLQAGSYAGREDYGLTLMRRDQDAGETLLGDSFEVTVATWLEETFEPAADALEQLDTAICTLESNLRDIEAVIGKLKGAREAAAEQEAGLPPTLKH